MGLDREDNGMCWTTIKSQEDANHLNDIFWAFHDSVLKEICFDVGYCVEKDLNFKLKDIPFYQSDLNMKYADVPISRFLFQRIYKDPSVIEMEFRDVIHINIQPKDISCILQARLYFQNGIFYWSSFDCPYDHPEKNVHTWITAKEVSWRVRDDLIGDKKIYVEANICDSPSQ